MRPMLFVTVAFTAALAVPLISCETAREPAGGPAMSLVNASGQAIGTVRAWQTAGGVSFRIDATGLPHGVHGLHVHAVGRCDPPDFTTAGGHWNPAARKHGMNNPQEYFAESTESFFGTNDFYPFVRPELKEFDPDMYAYLEKTWGKR